MRPGSIAVIGASSRSGTVGHEIVRSLLEAGFGGAIYPVNPKGDAVEGLTGYRSVAERFRVSSISASSPSRRTRSRPSSPDCAAKGARGLVVISGGFAEVGAEGAQRQRELTSAARKHGMRIIGPNCVGVVNTDPSVRLDATFGAATAIPGPIALASQSGAVGIAVLNAATRAGMGISSFVSLGNKADVSGNDFLQYWEDDERTKVVLLYLESFGNPTKFARLDTADRTDSSRSSRSRAAAPPPAARQPAHTPRRWPPTTTPYKRCSTTAASCASTRSTTSSTPPWCSRISRYLRADGLPSSATPVARGSWAQTPVRART